MSGAVWASVQMVRTALHSNQTLSKVQRLTSLWDVLFGRDCFAIDGDAKRFRAVLLLGAEDALDTCIGRHSGRASTASRFTMARCTSVERIDKVECCSTVREREEWTRNCPGVSVVVEEISVRRPRDIVVIKTVKADTHYHRRLDAPEISLLQKP